MNLWEKLLFTRASLNCSNNSNECSNLTLVTVQPVLWQDEEGAAGFWGSSDGARWVLEESHWRCRKLTKALQWVDFFDSFECECGTWQRHLSLRQFRKTCVLSQIQKLDVSKTIRFPSHQHAVKGRIHYRHFLDLAMKRWRHGQQNHLTWQVQPSLCSMTASNVGTSPH